MAYTEFDGELDGESPGYVEFSGELDKPESKLDKVKSFVSKGVDAGLSMLTPKKSIADQAQSQPTLAADPARIKRSNQIGLKAFTSAEPVPEEGGFINSAGRTIGQNIKGAGQVAADYLGAGSNNAVKQYGQAVIDANPTAVNSLGDIADKPGTAVAEATGNAAPSMAGMIGARAVGQGITALSPLAGPAAPLVAAAGQVVSWLGPAAIAALPSYGGIREKQISNDPAAQQSAKAKAIAAMGAAAVAGIEVAFGPQNWALAAMTKQGRAQMAEKFAATTLAGSIGKGAVKGSAIEGAEELAQNPIEQLAAGDNPTTPENLKDTAFGAAMGAIGGGVFGGGSGMILGKPASEQSDGVLKYTAERGGKKAKEIAQAELDRRANQGVDPAVANAPESTPEAVQRIIATGKDKADDIRGKSTESPDAIQSSIFDEEPNHIGDANKMVAAPDAPTPEPVETLNAQLNALADGRKPGVLLTPGEPLPNALPQGVKSADVPGRGTLLYRDDSTLHAALNGQMGTALGYGIDEKPADATHAVTARDEQGNVIQDVATDGSKSVLQAAKNVAGPGGTVEVRPVADAMVERDANTKTKDGLSNLLGKVAKRAAMESQGRAALDELEERNGSPAAEAKKFWSETYFKLPAKAQATFTQLLKGHTGMEPGVAVSVDRDGKVEHAKDWQDVADLIDLPNSVEHLEGTDRGFVALMADANKRFASTSGATQNTDTAPATAIENKPRETQPPVNKEIPTKEAAAPHPIRPLLESLIKRRAAAKQIGKERSLSNAVSRAKEVMEGKRTDAALESKWFRLQAAAMRKADPATADMLLKISETIKPADKVAKQKPTDYDGSHGKTSQKDTTSARVRGDKRTVSSERGGRILANGIAETIQKHGVSALIGQKIDSPAKLAELAQIYRNPKYETFRIFFTKGASIVHASGVTSRLPGSTPIFPEDMTPEQGAAWIKGMMESSGADGYWMLHNHPSGIPTPSKADIDATKGMAKLVPGLKGHVIINSNKYAQIMFPNGKISARVIDRHFSEEMLLKASKPHPYIGKRVAHPGAVAAIGKSFQKEGWVTLIGVSGLSGVRSIAEIPSTTFTNPMFARAAIRRFSRSTGAESIFVYGSASDLTAGNASDLITDGFLRAAVDENGASHTGNNKGKSFGKSRGQGGIEIEQSNAPFNPSWDAPEPSKMDNLIYTLQNKHVDLKRVVEAIKTTGAQLTDQWNTYLQEELFHGRAAKRTQDFVNRELKPIMMGMKLRGQTVDELDKYLHARHAEEANNLIADRDPNMPDGGSGMTTKDAKDYLANLPADKRTALENTAKQVDAVITKTRNLYVSYGLIDKDTADSWENMFKHYVPLMREDHDGGMGIGQGFSIKGKEAKHRTGSKRKVVDILANIALQRERAIVRGEKNRVAVSLAGLAKLNPNPDFWTFQNAPQRHYNEKTGLVEERADPQYKNRANVIVAKIKDSKGKVQEKAVIFNEQDERAMRMAAAMKNLDATQLEGALGVSAAITRYFAAINTQYNPVFGVVNLTRDLQASLLNLSSTQIAGHKAQVLKNIVPAIIGIYRASRANTKGKAQVRSPMADLWDEMQQEGGMTGYRDLFKTSEDRANAIKGELDPTAWMNSGLGKIFTAGGALKVPLAVAQKRAKWLFDWLSDYNQTLEGAMRLSVYKVAIDNGVSKPRAASIAKNISVNFNRKGQSGQQAGALYAFFNAAMQGTARMGETMTTMEKGDPKTFKFNRAGKTIIAGGISLGVIQALALAAAGFDDDEPPEFVRERSLIIPIGEKKYITIPMPLGFHAIPNIGRLSTEFALGGFKKPAEYTVKLFSVFAEAFNPIGNAGMSLQTIAPTAIDPLAALAENRDWTGKPIYKEDISKLSPTPGFSRNKDTASDPAKWIAEAINTISGGNKYVPGMASPTADQIDYLFGQVTGGVGREAGKAQQSIKAAYTGEDLPPHKIPLVGRFYGDSSGQSSQGNAFYSNLKRINEVEAELKGRHKDKLPIDEFKAENPEYKLVNLANLVERTVSKQRKIKSDLIKHDAPREQVKAVEDRITQLMSGFNGRVKELKQKQLTAH
jgi:hypothetical protein